MEDGSHPRNKGAMDMAEEALESVGLPHQKKAWSQHELLASVLSNYLQVHASDGGRWPSWNVSAQSDDIHQDVNDLNAHLERLGWMGKLTRDEGWKFTVFPRPERQFPRMNTLLLFWVLSALTLTLAGDVWMSSSRPVEGWFNSTTLVDALLGYTLPILLVLLLASTLQRFIAARFGVRSGHIMPVPDFTIAFYALGLFPSNWLFWPFGVLLIPTLPRMDARPWPNRASLGYTALSVPLTLGFFGAVLFFLGLALTPEYLASSTMPLITDPPAFLGLLAIEFVASDAWVRLIWAHPWVHAGGMLMLFAWVSILPIPTFPGGRLLIARMGMFEARSSSTQTLIFVTVLFCAYVFGVFEAFSLWFLIFALLLPLLFFFGNDLRIPLILDETTGLREEEHRRMGLLLLVMFILLLPAAQPVVHDEDWDGDMTFSVPEPDRAGLQEDGTWLSRTKVTFTNPSSLQQDYAVHVVFEQNAHDWSVVWDCDGEDSRSLNGNGCGSALLPQRTAYFWLNLTWEGETAPTMARGAYIVSVNGAYDVVPFTVRPALEVVPDERWYDELDGATVLRCVDLEGALVNSSQLEVEVGMNHVPVTQTPLVSLEGLQGLKTNLSEVPERLCLSGLDPLVFQPSLATLRINNDTFAPLLPERRPLVAHVPEHGWTISPENEQPWGALLQNGGVLQANNPICPINASISTPPRPLDSEWIWDTMVRSSGNVPLIETGQNLTLLIEEGTNLTLCSDPFSPYPEVSFAVERGPELLLDWMGTETRFWTTAWAIAANGTLLDTDMGTLTFTNPSNESVPFRLAREGSLGEDWQHNWDGLPLAPGNTTLELVPPSSPLATMWLTLESGTVVLHVASYD